MRRHLSMEKGMWIFRLVLIYIVLAVMCVPSRAEPFQDTLADGFSKVVENAALTLYANESAGSVALVNKQSGKVWFSNPILSEQNQDSNQLASRMLASQFTVVYRSNDKIGESYKEYKTDNYSSSIAKNAFQIIKEEHGIKFIFSFPDEGFVIPLRYRLEKDYLSAELIFDEMVSQVDKERVMNNTFTREEQVYHYRNVLIDITLLPYLCSGDTNQQGYLFVPDGPGGLIHLNNGKRDIDMFRAQVYGPDRVIPGGEVRDATIPIKMPVFGIKTGDEALMGIIDQNDASSYIEAAVSGRITDYNNVCSGASIHYFDGVNISRKVASGHSHTVRYYPLSGDQANYSGMARRYRQYMVEEKGLGESENPQAAAIYADVYGGVKKQKYIMGIPFTAVETLTKYSDCITILDHLKSAGVSRANVIYNAWMQGGHKTALPVKVKYEEKLGGAKDFERLMQYAENNNFVIFPELDFVNIYRSANNISQVFDCAQRINTAPGYQYNKARNSMDNDQKGKWSILKLGKMEETVKRFFQNEKSELFPQFYLSNMANTITSDFARDGIVRGDAAGHIENIMNDAKHAGKAFLSDWANAYAIPYVDYMTDVSVWGNGYDIIDETVPFYQMVIHGYISYSTTPLNLSSDPGLLFLKAVETGAAMKYSWIAEDVVKLQRTELNRLFSANYNAWIKNAAQNYQRYSGLYDLINKGPMLSHRKIAENVYESQYENGIKVLVNYNSQDYSADGVTVKGEDFVVVGGDIE